MHDYILHVPIIYVFWHWKVLYNLFLLQLQSRVDFSCVFLKSQPCQASGDSEDLLFGESKWPRAGIDKDLTVVLYNLWAELEALLHKSANQRLLGRTLVKTQNCQICGMFLKSTFLLMLRLLRPKSFEATGDPEKKIGLYIWLKTKTSKKLTRRANHKLFLVLTSLTLLTFLH